jgi:hypothetical protein
MVQSCHQSLVKLAEQNRVQLIWVLGYNQLARLGFRWPFIGPEPACSISVGIAKKAVRDWTNRDHKNIGNP